MNLKLVFEYAIMYLFFYHCIKLHGLDQKNYISHKVDQILYPMI